MNIASGSGGSLAAIIIRSCRSDYVSDGRADANLLCKAHHTIEISKGARSCAWSAYFRSGRSCGKKPGGMGDRRGSAQRFGQRVHKGAKSAWMEALAPSSGSIE